MAEQTDVKVFISWSGDLAKAVAVALRGWLPLLFDRVVPWASDSDIAAGQRGLAQIEAELADSRFGVVVVTAANQHQPWLNFEAGALSKVVGGDLDQRVVPLVVDLASPTDVTGPLAQFQGVLARADGVRGLVRSVADVAGIDRSVADTRFEAYWPQLEVKVEEAKQSVTASGQAAKPERRDKDAVLDEILLHVRTLARNADEARSPRSSAAATRAFHRWLDRRAAEHGLQVIEYPAGRGTGRREVVLGPVDTYSSTEEQAFRAAFKDGVAPDDLDVHIMVRPF